MFFVSASLTENATTAWRNHFSTTFLGRFHLTSLVELERDYTMPAMKLPDRFLPGEILSYLDKNKLVWSKRLKIGAAVYNNESGGFEGSLANVIGLNFKEEQERLSNLRIVEGEYDPATENGAMVWEEFAHSFGWQVGDEITLFIKDIDGDAYPYTFTITGILSQHFEPGLAGKGVMILFPLVLVDYDTITRMLGVEDGQVMEAAVWENEGMHGDTLRKMATSADIQIFHAEEGFGAVYGIVDFVQFIGVSLEAFILVVLIVSSLNINMMGFLERRREIGAMMAMGAKPRWIVRLLFGEMIVFSTAAFIVSLILYGLLVLAGAKGVDFGELAVMFAGKRFRAGLVPLSLLYAYIAVAAAMLISTLYPAILTSRIDPVEVFREANV